MDATGVSVSIHNHGTALDEKKRKIKCNYCGKVVSGNTRLKCHLGGIRGDVAPCAEVSTDVKELMRKKLFEKKRGNLSKEVGELYHPNLPWKRNWSHHSDVDLENEPELAQNGGYGKAKHVKMSSVPDNSGTESNSFPRRNMGSQGADNGPEDLSLRQVQTYIGRFFYETGTDLSAAKSPSFGRMMKATLFGCQMGYKVPSIHDLKGWILHDQVKEMQEYVNEIKKSWASTGCSILLDGWVDGNGRDLINILVDCPKGTIYLRTCDISAFVGDVDSLQLFFNNVIEDVGVGNVVQIVTYSTSTTMEAVGKRLTDTHKTFFWTVSASHCIELMLQNIGMVDAIKGTLGKAKTITKFTHSHAGILNILRNHTCGNDLVKPSKINAAMPFLTLENIVSERDNLRKMFASADWKTSTWASGPEGKRVAALVADQSFWTGARMVLKATIPLVRVLELINEGDKHQLGYIYETMDQVKETIKEEFKSKKSLYLPFWQAIDEIWNKYLHSPLHAAGYYLNPALFYASDFYLDPEVAMGLFCCIVRMAEDKHVQDLITLQVDEYRLALGAFGQGSANSQRLNVPPGQLFMHFLCSILAHSVSHQLLEYNIHSIAKLPAACWWSSYGGQCAELQRLAIRILSQTCNGASKYQLKRSIAEKLLTKGVNGVERLWLLDLAFVHYNMQLQSTRSTGNNILLDEVDMLDDWIVDGAQEMPSQNEATTWSALGSRITATDGVISGREEISVSLPKVEPDLERI